MGQEITEGSHPFAKVEAMLQKPEADGVFVTLLRPGSPQEEAGVRLGDIITSISGESKPDFAAFYKAMQPEDKDDKNLRTLSVFRDGVQLEIESPPTTRGISVCTVEKGVSAWAQVPDYTEEPDFSALRGGGEITMRNNFGEEPAGFELVEFKQRGELLDVEIVFRLGGGDKPENRWEYFTRSRSTHRLDKYLSAVSTAFWQGKPEKETLDGDVSLEKDGFWRGTRPGKNGAQEKVEVRATTVSVITPYTGLLMALTMPLRKGASLTFMSMTDGSANLTGRDRLECTGKSTVKVDGRNIEAWCFALRHYGTDPDEHDEKFYVTDDRRLVRIDWGPNYGGCWTEAMPRDKIMKTVPKHVR